MLTALDFPDELLYSAEAIWLRDAGAGSARLGLNTYAAFEGDSDVYLVKLPRAGARIVKGEPFGHVDLGRRSIPLVAPVSGTILFPNTDLRDDPGLLAKDPYGRGYLLEVEGIDGEELDALHERDDAVLFYSRFPSEGDISADQVYEPGRPWASVTEIKVGEGVLARSRLMPPLGNEMFTPDWCLGDTWQVDFTHGEETTRFRFEVLGKGSVMGEETTRIEVREVPAQGSPAPRIARILHYRVDDFTLAAWDEVPTGNPTMQRRTYNPRGRECWLGHQDPKDGFMLDHPRLPVSLDDESYDLPETKGVPELMAVSHYVKFRAGLTRVECEMRADIAREDGRGTEKLLSTIHWQRGLPWWSEAARMLGEAELVKGTLVK